MRKDSKNCPATAAIAVASVLAISLLLASCSGTPKLKGIPEKLPDIQLAGTSGTPPHRMQSYEYPFDSAGNYVADWAAEGERRAGRPASATDDDEQSWSKSHGGHSASSKESNAKKKNSGGVKHTVKPGETLYGIAKKFGTTEAKIEKANGLKNDITRDGAVLIIPK